MTFQEWCFKAHRDTNHLYEGYIPYEYHLKLTLEMAKEFIGVVADWKSAVIYDACVGHDLFEDARISYNDVVVTLSAWSKEHAIEVAEIILAVTEYPGRNREERHPPIYWQHIRETPGAKFVKMCDKLANVHHGRTFSGSKLGMHVKEHEKFMKDMKFEPLYAPMVEKLQKLLFQ